MSTPMLRRLLLRSFRSIPSAVIDFDNPTLLVGQNGAGKSNVVDAFAFLAEVMTSPLSAAFDRRGGIAAVRNRRPRQSHPPNMGFRVDIDCPDNETKEATYAFELRAMKNYGYEIVREQCTVTGRDGSSRWWFDRRNRPGFKSNVESLTPVLEPESLALPLIGGDPRFRPVVKFLGEMRVHRIEPFVLREMQDPDTGQRLNPDGSNVASVLREIERDSQPSRQQLIALLEHIVPNTIDVRPKAHGNKLALEFTQEWAQSKRIRFEAYNMSDGTLRALGLLAAVFQPSRPTVLVIEEPEATIHPGALDAVSDILQHASALMQVVATTHSPDLLDAKWVKDSILKIVGSEEGATRVSPVSAEVRSALHEHLMGAGELLRANALTPMNSSDLFVPDPQQLPLFETQAS